MLIAHGTGHRIENGEFLKFKVTHAERLMEEAAGLRFFLNAVVNAVMVLRGKESAMGVVENVKLLSELYGKLGHVDALVRGLGLRMMLRRAKNIGFVLGNMERFISADRKEDKEEPEGIPSSV